MKKVMDLYQNSNKIQNDAFDRIVAEIHIKKQKENIKSFLICGCEPGVGTTTIAINLAIAMANSDWNTILLDADMRKNIEFKRLNDNAEAGLTDYLNDLSTLEEATFETNYPHLKYVASGNFTNNAVSLLCSVKMKELLAKLSKEYDYVIIDAPSIASAVDASILATEANAVVLVTAQQQTHKKSIKEAKKQMDRVNANVQGIIVNKVSAAEYKRAMKNYDYFKRRRYIKKKAGK